MFYCVTTPKFSVLVNGSPAEFFRSSRGLRQGDSLSPLLFIMVTEVLSKMITRVEGGYIQGFSIGRGVVRSRISNLQMIL